MATRPIVICGKTIDKKALQTIFCLILTFNHVTNKLFQNLKDIIHIIKEVSFDFLMLVHIKSHNYDLDNNFSNKAEETIRPPPFLFSSILISLALVRSTCDIDEVSCQFFLTLPVYQTRTKDSKDKLLKEY